MILPHFSFYIEKENGIWDQIKEKKWKKKKEEKRRNERRMRKQIFTTPLRICSIVPIFLK